MSDLYILWDIRFLFSKIRKYRGRSVAEWIFIGFAIATLILLTIAVCLPRRNASEDIYAVLWLLYIVITITISQICYIPFSLIGRIPQIFHAKPWKIGMGIGLFITVIVFCSMWWGTLVGRNQIQVVDIPVAFPKLPASFNGYKIAQISDLHVDTWGDDTAFVERLVDSVNNLNPDLIVFTGDIVSRHSKELKPFINSLSRLKAKDGVISVLGNHDYGDYITWPTAEDKAANLSELKDMQKTMGWSLLDNVSTTIKNESGDSLVIIGIGNWGEPPFSKYGNLLKAYPESKLYDDNFKLLLSHNPEHWNQEVSKISNIDLTLSGHTHAMQLMLQVGDWRWSPSQYKYPFWAGLYERNNEKGNVKLYVNIGAGEVGFPMRLGAKPEITLFTLTNE